MVDGAETSSQRRRPNSPIVMVAIGLAVGLGFGAVLFSSMPSADTSAGAAGTTLPSAVVLEPTDVGITAAVTGFKDALVAVAVGETASLEHLLWPREGPLLDRPMYTGEQVAFDADGQHLAVTQPVPDMEGVVLSVGRFNSVQPVASGVTSFAWHDSAAAHMGYTTVDDGEWALWELSPNLETREIADGLVPGGRVVGWGDWGWAIQAPDDRVVLLNPDGELRDTHSGVALTSMSEGWVLVMGDSLQMVSAGGGARGLGVPDLGPVLSARFSPLGDLAAVSFRGRTLIVSLDDPSSNPVAEIDLVGATSLAWTSDERFLVVPSGRGVLLIDLESREPTIVLDEYQIVAADVILTASP